MIETEILRQVESYLDQLPIAGHSVTGGVCTSFTYKYIGKSRFEITYHCTNSFVQTEKTRSISIRRLKTRARKNIQCMLVDANIQPLQPVQTIHIDFTVTQ